MAFFFYIFFSLSLSSSASVVCVDLVHSIRLNEGRKEGKVGKKCSEPSTGWGWDTFSDVNKL
jgi:hypothetical protein